MLPSRRPASSGLRLALAFLLVWAAGTRAWVASRELNAGRYWDERYSFANVAALLEGELRPANVYYPTLSYLPQGLLLAGVTALGEATGSPRLAVREGSRFTPLAYLLCRLFQVLLGVLSLVLVYRLGTRLFSPATGVLAAFFLAAVPWHIRQSAIFKPDILLVVTVLLALDWALAAWRFPTSRRCLLAGLGTGLAAASKYNGAAAGLPLLLLLGLYWRRRPERRRLLLGAVAAVAVFFLLHPHLLHEPGFLVADLGDTFRHYARKEAMRSGSHLGMPLHAALSLTSSSFHGAVLGLVALAGLGVLAARLLPRPPGAASGTRAEIALFLAFPAGYTILYAAVTANPSPHNWLPLAPFSSLAAAWLLVAAGDWVAARPRFGSRRLRAGAFLLAAGIAVVNGSAYAYSAAVPSTWKRAGSALLGPLAKDLPLRLVVYEADPRTRLRVTTGRRRRPAVVGVDSLAALPADLLAAADAEVYRGRTRLPAAPREDASLVLPPSRVWVIEPAPFRASGPPLLVRAHPWARIGPPLPLHVIPGPSPAFQVPGGRAPGAELVSFEIDLHHRAEVPRATRGQVGPLPVRFFWAGRERLISERVRLPETGELRLELGFLSASALRSVRLHRWLPEGPDRQPAGPARKAAPGPL